MAKKPVKKAAPKKAAKKPATKKKVVAVKGNNFPSTLASIDEEYTNLKAEVEKFNGGNKSSGRRARKALQAIRKLAAQGRKEIQAIVSSM